MAAMARLQLFTVVAALCCSLPGPAAADDTPYEKNHENAYATLCTTDDWVPLAATLGHSLKKSKPDADMVVITTSSVSKEGITKLKEAGFKIKRCKRMDGKHLPYELTHKEGIDQVRLDRMPEVFTKLKLWLMTQYKKVVYLDSDAFLPNPEENNVDELFNWPQFSASPHFDDGKKVTSSAFNSGVVVLEPSEATYHDMLHTLKNDLKWVKTCQFCGDQDFLSYYFRDVKKMYKDETPCDENDGSCTQLPFKFNWRSEQSKTATVPATNARVIHVKGVNNRGAMLANCDKPESEWKPDYLRKNGKGFFLHKFCEAYKTANGVERVENAEKFRAAAMAGKQQPSGKKGKSKKTQIASDLEEQSDAEEEEHNQHPQHQKRFGKLQGGLWPTFFY